MSPTSSPPSEKMTLSSRAGLKNFFKNSSRLSEASFEVLIDSMLNKRDDQFHGVWQPGRTYLPGDVVIYDKALWIVGGEGEICSTKPPSKDNPDWESLIIPVDDDDWEVLKEEDVMWAKVIGRIGIGIGSHEGEGERPQAWLDVRKAQQGRWLVFPENAEHTVLTLLHYASTVERSYLLTGLSLEEAAWLTDATKGFVWRMGEVLPNEEDVLSLAPDDGKTMMVVKPKLMPDGSRLATLGLNVEDPEAMLDITDKSRGQLLFTPDEKKDPALTIVNLDPDCAENYLALGVGKREAAFVSDAPDGFIFRQGGEYGEYCNAKNVGQGDLLMVVQQNSDHDRPQVGIGTGTPNARLDIRDDDAAQVLILPEVLIRAAEDDSENMPGTEENAVPAIALLDLTPENATYLTTGIGETVAGWATNAEHGFVFRQGGLAFINDNHQNIDQDQGTTFLAIREDGRIGMGTEDPYTQVEITSQLGSGKFLFNLDPHHKVNPALGILNRRPGSRENYFTVGADNNHAILVTDSQNGFLFKKGKPSGTNDSEIDVNQGDTLVSIRPVGKGRVGVGKLPLDYEMDIHGLTRTFTLYQDTDEKYLTQDKPLSEKYENSNSTVLGDLQRLQPITFEWNSTTEDFSGEGTQIGFRAHEVDDVFPEVVRTAGDGTQAVAYQNLVPVLVQALKDLTAARDDTQQELDELRDQFNQHQREMEERLTALEDRIRGCEDNL